MCPTAPYDWVVESKGQFRTDTSLTPLPGKCFTMQYVDCTTGK